MLFICHKRSVVASRDYSFKKIPLSISKLSFLNPFKIYCVYQILKSHKVDSIVLNAPQDFKLGVIAAAIAGVSKIIYRRGMPHPLKESAINRFCLNRTTHLIANSEFVKQSILKNYPGLQDKVSVIPNSETRKFSRKDYPEKLIIGSLGRLTYQKGHEYLISVAKILKNQGVPFEVLIGGTGVLDQELRVKVNNFDLDEHFSFLGKVEASEFFSRVGILAFTSRFEGLSNVLIETLVFDTPCIAFDTSSNSEVIIDESNGIIIPAYDIELFAASILRVHSDPNLRQKISLNSLKILEKKFNDVQIKKKLKSLLL